MYLFLYIIEKKTSEVIIPHNEGTGTCFKISVKSICCPEKIKMKHELKRGHEIDYTVKEQLKYAISGYRGKGFYRPPKNMEQQLTPQIN